MNKLSQQELWENIQKFNLDDPHSNFPFSKKLAKENNWSASFTAKAIEEYKKFIYLCCISPTGASPSDIVDEVWHMHLTYTSSYWIDFCKNTLKKDIHHHPSKGGFAETEKHKNWYAATLVLYENTFGTKPPDNIWPLYDEPEIDEPVYDKKTVTNTVVLFFITAVTFIAVTNMYQLRGEDFLYYYPALAATGLCFMLYQLNEKSKRLQIIVSDHMPASFTKWQIIKFLNGPQGCYQAALTELIKDGKIVIQGKNFILKYNSSNEVGNENPLWENLAHQVSPNEPFSYDKGFSLLDQEKIRHTGFEKLFRLSKKTDYHKFIIPGFVLLAGIGRVLQGLSNNKPVDYLVAEIFVIGFIFIAINSANSYTSKVFKKVKETWVRDNDYGNTTDTAVNFSIVGILAIGGITGYNKLRDLFYEKAARSSGNSSSSESSTCSGGSSCGSSCGGGGCGGCGGGD